MELWQWAASCCARRRRHCLPGAPSAYHASLQPGAPPELSAAWQRRLAQGHCELLALGDSLRVARAVPRGAPLLWEAAACHAAAGPQAVERMAQALETHPRLAEVMKLPGERFTGETTRLGRDGELSESCHARNPLHSILASNAKLCTREPDAVALWLGHDRFPADGSRIQ